MCVCIKEILLVFFFHLAKATMRNYNSSYASIIVLFFVKVVFLKQICTLIHACSCMHRTYSLNEALLFCYPKTDSSRQNVHISFSFPFLDLSYIFLSRPFLWLAYFFLLSFFLTFSTISGKKNTSRSFSQWLEK